MIWTIDYKPLRQKNRRFPSCISPLLQSESKCEAFHMEISFIHTQILVHLHVNKTDFHMKGFALGLALKQRRKTTRKSPIARFCDVSWGLWLGWGLGTNWAFSFTHTSSALTNRTLFIKLTNFVYPLKQNIFPQRFHGTSQSKVRY